MAFICWLCLPCTALLPAACFCLFTSPPPAPPAQPSFDDKDVLCRLETRDGKGGWYPVLELERHEEVLAREHEALGHPGYETLYTHVSAGSIAGHACVLPDDC